MEIHYDAEVHRIRIEDGVFTGAEARIGGFPKPCARTLVAAAGGFKPISIG